MDVLNDIEDGKLYEQQDFIESNVSIMQTREGWIIAYWAETAIEFYATKEELIENLKFYSELENE